MGRQEHPGRSFVSLLATAAVAAVALHSLGALPYLRVPWNDLEGWIRRAPLEDVVASLLRLAAMIAAAWLAGSSLLYLLARLSPVSAAAEVMGRVTPAVARHLADRMVAGSLLLSALAAPIPATGRMAGPPAPTPAAEVVAGDYLPPALMSPAPRHPHGGRPEPALVIGWLPEALRSPPPPDGAGSPIPPSGSRIEVVVAPGDNFWRLAARRLGETFDTPPSTDEIDSYWRRVVEENRRRIRSRDPDLLYPGEVVILPAPRPVRQG